MTGPSRRAVLTATATATMTASAATLLSGCGRGDREPASRTGAPTTGAPTPAGHHPTSAAPSGSPSNSASPYARSAPTKLRIPAIGVNTPLLRLGLTADGEVQVPPVTAHDRAGWYENSPTPGATGPAVLLGHVTVGPYGDGVFRHLDRLRHGDRVSVHLRDGSEPQFAVTSVRTVAKARFPTEEVYGDVEEPELRLITCGGPRTGDGYQDNVIVFAHLVRPLGER